MKKSIINVTRRMMPVLMVAVMSVSTAQAQEIYKIESNPVTVQLHTNGLYDLALCPNVGVELQTEIGLAFQLDYVGAWWNSPSRNRFYSNYAFQTELRYYLDHKDDAFAFDGWHAGLYGQMVTYDFEFGGRGYQSPLLDMSFGIGAAVGYTMPLSRRWSMDFTLGLGYFQSKYYVYDPDAKGGYQKINTKLLKFFGPTRLEVSFVWNLNKDNK